MPGLKSIGADGMGRKSTVAGLPDDAKQYILARLTAGNQTLNELIEDLRQRFPDLAQSGELPSRSALHRYGSNLDRRLGAIRASTEAAKMIQAQAGDDQDARSEALTALVQTELFEAILSLQEADDPEADPGDRIAMLSSAAKNIATLTGSSIRLKQFQVQAKARAREAAESVDKLAKSGGLSADAAADLRRQILGIAA